MNEDKKIELKVGITVLSAIILFFVVFGWAKNIAISGKAKEIKIEFESVMGLEVGDNVTLNGVRKGFVKEVLTTESKVHVTISLDKDVKLKDNATFTITMLDLMGGKKIEIFPGTSNIDLNFAKMAKGGLNADIPAVMAMAGTLTEKIPNLMMKIDTTITYVNSYLQDQQIKNDLKSSLANLSFAALNVKDILVKNRDNIDKIMIGGVELTTKANNLIDNNSKGIEQTIEKVDKLLTQSNHLIQKISSLVDETTSGKNNVGKLLYDDKLFKDVNETLLSVRKLTDTLNTQLNARGINIDAKINLFK